MVILLIQAKHYNSYDKILVKRELNYLFCNNQTDKSMKSKLSLPFTVFKYIISNSFSYFFLFCRCVVYTEIRFSLKISFQMSEVICQCLLQTGQCSPDHHNGKKVKHRAHTKWIHLISEGDLKSFTDKDNNVQLPKFVDSLAYYYLKQQECVQ